MTANPPPGRLGPRPLPLHLATALLTWASSQAVSVHLKSGSVPWNESLAKRGSDLQQELAALLNPTAGTDHPEDRDARAHGENWFAFDDALEAEIASRLAALTGGILAYQHHPYRREQDRHTVVWQEGTTRLLRQGAGAGRPLLVVPSLINRYHVLDLMPGRSLLKHLAAAGYAPHVVDWGRPGAIERSFALEDYVDGRLGRALDTVLAQTGTRPHVIGYCMGGLLALALAQRRLSDIKSLVLLATPWDFAVGADSIAATLRAWAPWLNNVIDMAGELPTDIIQSMFFYPRSPACGVQIPEIRENGRERS